jgi:hypothetical protein
MIIAGGIGNRRSQLQRNYITTSWSYTDDLTGGKSYTSDKTAGTEYIPDKAFDDNLGTRWYATENERHWICVDFGSGIRIVKLRLYTEHNNYIGDFTLEGSDNKADWSSVMSDSAPLGLQWYEFEFSNANSFRYYRVYMDTSHAAYINEIEMMGIA